MDCCPPGQKKGHGREVAAGEGSIAVLVEYEEKNLNITKPRTITNYSLKSR